MTSHGTLKLSTDVNDAHAPFTHIERAYSAMVTDGTETPFDITVITTEIDHPLAEQDRNFAAIVYPETDAEEVIMEGILPALEERFNMPADRYPRCTTRFCEFLRAYLVRRLNSCNARANSHITVTCSHATFCITCYPTDHKKPK